MTGDLDRQASGVDADGGRRTADGDGDLRSDPAARYDGDDDGD